MTDRGDGDAFVLLVGLGCFAWAEVYGIHAERGESGHVGPRLFGGRRQTGQRQEFLEQRILCTDSAGWGDIDELHLGLPGDELADLLLRSVRALTRGEAVVEVHLEGIGDDVARTASRCSRDGEHLVEREPIEFHFLARALQKLR